MDYILMYAVLLQIDIQDREALETVFASTM